MAFDRLDDIVVHHAEDGPPGAPWRMAPMKASRSGSLMPWIILVDILPQPNAFRIYDLRSRFMGSSFCQFFGVDDQQHLLVSEIGSPFAERWFDDGPLGDVRRDGE